MAFVPEAGLRSPALQRCGRRLPKVIVPILIAATLALMAVAGLLIVISGLFYIAGKGGGQVALLGIQVGFWAGLCLVCAFVALSVYAIRSEGEIIIYFTWMIVCFVGSLFLIGVSGLVALPTPWRFLAPFACVVGALVLLEWLVKYRPLMK
jgi:hypothetical protein